MFKEFCKMVKESLQDSATGKYSHARILSALVALAATIFIWKLIILGGMSVEYFIAYLAYGAGNQSLNKFLDNKDDSRTIGAETRRIETQRMANREMYEQQSSTVIKTDREVYTDEDIPRPARNY